MNKIIVPLFAVLFSPILFLSCKKTEQASPQATETLPQLSSVTFTYDTSSYRMQESFSYNEDGTLAGITDESWDAATTDTKKVIGELEAFTQPTGLFYTTHQTNGD